MQRTFSRLLRSLQLWLRGEKDPIRTQDQLSNLKIQLLANLATDKKATTDVTQNDEKEYCDLSGVYTDASDVMRKVELLLNHVRAVQESRRMREMYRNGCWSALETQSQTIAITCKTYILQVNPFIPCLPVLLYHLNQYLFVYR
eukprot:TRINITY_DN439_c0_g1_i3.p1 TRINITY_DN439_c0_g1~~TRINITY_DN439_c0_g1_i3.p1  ORF type:complete len:144 (+),score=6.44 TRINITY_DN439_c0_g1_i3:185-616(+)